MVSSKDFTIMDILKTCSMKKATSLPVSITGLVLELALLMVGPYGIRSNLRPDDEDVALRLNVYMMSCFDAEYFHAPPQSGTKALLSAMKEKLERILSNEYYELEAAKHFLADIVMNIASVKSSSSNMFYNVLVALLMYVNYPRRTAGESDGTLLSNSEKIVRELRFEIRQPTYHNIESWRREVQRIIPFIPGFPTSIGYKHSLDAVLTSDEEPDVEFDGRLSVE